MLSMITTSPALMAKPANHCQSDRLKADYSISTTQVNNKTKQTQQVTLWRKQNQVAQQFHQNGISEIWYQTKNKRVQLTRHFEKFQRGIEYQPVDMKNNQDIDWLQKSTFLTQAFIDSLTQEQAEHNNHGCEKIVEYQKQTKNETIKLKWMPKLKLISALSIERNDTVKTWTLQQTDFDNQTINNQFAKWNKYNTTDYADIGDSEDDPFLQKMINMGFSSHSHSAGNSARNSGGHGHHH